MSSLLYKGHSLIYGATFDNFTGSYAPTGQVLWHGAKGKHGTHPLRFANYFPRLRRQRPLPLKRLLLGLSVGLRSGGHSNAVAALTGEAPGCLQLAPGVGAPGSDERERLEND
jgi:hypothetical protein